MNETLKELYDSVADIRTSIPNWAYRYLPEAKRIRFEIAMARTRALLEATKPVDVTGTVAASSVS